MIIIFFFILIFFFLYRIKKKQHFVNKEIIIKQVFKTPEEQRKGLMHRKKLPDNQGFLFLYSTPRILSFWMKNTFVPLDIIFVDKNHRVVDIKENMIPHDTTSVASTKKALFAIEIKKGYVKRKNIKIGDTVSFYYL